jgi:hypothetical protein
MVHVIPHSRGTNCPSFAFRFTLSMERAQGKPGAGCTRGSRATKSTGVGPQVNRSIPAFPARWFTAYFVLFPVTGLFCHRHPQGRFHPAGLSASVGAPEPHDFAVRRCCVRLSQHPRPPHLTATFVTIASRPLSGETRGVIMLICPTAEAECFSREGWTYFW